MTSRHPHGQKIRGLSQATHVHCYARNGRRTQVLSAGKMAQRRQVDAAKRQGNMAGNAVPCAASIASSNHHSRDVI